MKRKYDSMYGRCLSFLLIAALLCASLGPAFASGPAGQGEKAGAAQSRKPEPPALRALSAKEMQGLVGSGAHRQQSFCGSHPWWPTEKGVNIGNGNLAVGAGDLSVPAGRGLGLNFTRTYNANDDTVGGFGIGWTYSYDMTLTESGSGTAIHKLPDGTRVYVLRNADGSYTPPAWCHDTYSSTYQTTDNGNGTLRSDATGDTVATKDGTTLTFTKTGAISGGSLRRLSGITDRNGNQLTLTYNTQVTYANGDTDTLLSSVTDSVGRQITLTWTNYGTQQNPIYRITGLSDGTRSVSYQYNGDYHLWKTTQTVGGVNRVWEYTYTTFNGSGWSEAGLLASVKDPVGNTTSYNYQSSADINGMFISQVIEPGYTPVATTFTIGYFPIYGGDWSVHLNNHGCTRYWFDDETFAKLRQETMTGQTGGKTWAWDSAMNLTTAKTILDLENGQYRTRTASMTYDSLGNLLTKTDPMNKTTTNTYYGSDKYYQLETVTDALGRVTRMDYGSSSAAQGQRGSLAWVRDARYSQTGRQMSFTYNSYGQKSQMTDLNNVATNYTYGDSGGNLTQVAQNPGGLNRTTTMQYDALGRMTQATDPMGQTTTISYNEASQPISVSNANETVSYGYNADGSVSSVSDNHGTVSYSYQYGRPAQVTDSVTGTVQYLYNYYGYRIQMIAPNGEVTYYNWPDGDCVLAYHMSWVEDNWDEVTSYTYDNLGRMKEAWSNNSLSTTYTYDDNDRLTCIETKWAGSRIVKFEYDYDDAGNRLHKYVTNADGSTRTETYGYDELYRLTSVNYGDGETQSYTFDPMGNRLSKTVNGVTTNYTYNNANMILTRGTNNYTNDANGNTLTGGGRSNTWDLSNRLTQCVYGGTTSTFTYRADGLRTRMTVGTTTTDYILDSSNVIQEKVGTTVTARYMSGNRGPEYRRGISTPPEWYVFDGLGSVVATVSDNGVVQSTKQYDGYGAVRASSGGTPSKHKYVGNLGHTSEDETGLIYMRARYMDPVTGRFESEDPAKDGVNWYIYVRANPICNRDENGKESMGETMTATFEGQRLQANWRSVQFSATNQGIRKLIKSVARRIGYDELNDHQIHTLIHEIKSMGMGPADNIGIDRYGFAWTEGGECIGWIFDWLL